MDGVDASIIQSDGEKRYKVILDKYFEYPKDIYENLSKDKTQKLIGSVGLGTAAVAVWIWNVYDLNRYLPSELDLSMNSKGQLEASFAF